MSQNYYAKSDASSAGAVLAAAREELNLSIAEVARHLKLSPAQVEALEEAPDRRAARREQHAQVCGNERRDAACELVHRRAARRASREGR